MLRQWHFPHLVFLTPGTGHAAAAFWLLQPYTVVHAAPLSALIIHAKVKQVVPADGICGVHNSSIVSQVPGSRRVSRVPGDNGVEAGPGGLAGPSKQDGVAAAALHAWHSCLILGAHAHVCHLPPR